MKETDLFEPIKKWFASNEYTNIYAEVPVTWGRADIVIEKRPVYICVELKKQMSFELLEQAIRRKSDCHYVYIAIPKRKTRVPALAYNIMIEQGIGLLYVHLEDQFVELQIPPKFNRPYSNINWDNLLKEEYKEHIGGSNDSSLWTPYKITINNVKGYLEHQKRIDLINNNDLDGWRKIDEILDYCEYHYANPKPSLSKALREIEQSWCEVKKENNKLYFRVKDKKRSS